MYFLFGKRILSVLISSVGIVAFSPLLLGLALWVRLDSPGPVLFRQKRFGKNRSYFYILKFRTMRVDAPHDVPTSDLRNPEQYTTRAGRILRRTSLDELPQLFNILKGDMCLIGPRPALWNQLHLIEERDRYGANAITPGLTGWAQIHGRDTLSDEEKARFDGEYVKNASAIMDLKCLFITFSKVAKGIDVFQ